MITRIYIELKKYKEYRNAISFYFKPDILRKKYTHLIRIVYNELPLKKIIER